ncbi:metallophosphoesterase [uncultured Metabacillus sp.]|uniref:metallophosphoesterase n=1 Tax=uncultured Metabacillus sp. TaxID=2860135 RepID=UPI0026311146|nr:metallophosphoesterase [uncultured Metabacillus sp.]
MYKGNHVFVVICITVLIILLLPTQLVKSNTLSHAQSKITASENFYQAHQYSSTEKNQMTVSENAARTEPPTAYDPLGEKEFSTEKYQALQEQNSSGNETYSVSNFPYHRFDIEVHKDVKSGDHVTVHWKGRSLQGRQVTMFAWNVSTEEWVELDRKIAGTSQFTLNGTVTAGEYVKEQKISVIVQDQIASQSKSFDYSFVWMSDTQYYAQDHPAVFKSITEWISQNKDVMNIKYVFHTGDIVNKGRVEQQWKRANSYMNTLDVAKVPYGVLPGNHDKGNNFNQYKKYFGKKRFYHKPYYGGSYQNNLGHYDLLSVKGKDYIFLYMGGDVEEREIKWMNKVLKRHSDRTAILAFHEYLQKNGKRSHQGNDIFEQIVVPNKNVAAVLCGHYYNSEVLVDELDDNLDGITDRKVYQILADYQKAPNGGNGYIRLLQIDEETNSIDIQTYSPYLDQYYYYDPENEPGKDSFTMDIDVKRKHKMVATSYFEVNVYKRIKGEKVVMVQ